VSVWALLDMRHRREEGSDRAGELSARPDPFAGPGQTGVSPPSGVGMGQNGYVGASDRSDHRALPCRPGRWRGIAGRA
jgi:hypothetical protein